MSPQYLRELADIADPQQLWRKPGLDRDTFTPEQKKQLDTGVALRRYAMHIERLRLVYPLDLSIIYTPLTPLGVSVAERSIETPPDHVRLRWFK